MTSRNDITGDSLSSKKNSDKFRNGWDAIWGGSESPKKEPSKKNKEKVNEEPS